MSYSTVGNILLNLNASRNNGIAHTYLTYKIFTFVINIQ